MVACRNQLKVSDARANLVANILFRLTPTSSLAASNHSCCLVPARLVLLVTPVAFRIVLLTPIVLFVVMGCSIGAPQLRTSATDGQGVLVTGCKNVSSSHKIGRLINENYLSTWGSASKEGTVAGLDETEEVEIIPGLQNWVHENTWGEISLERLKNLSLGSESNVYCRTYDAKKEKVFQAVKTVFRDYVSNRIVSSNVAQGTLVTDWYDRTHAVARWKDAYKVSVLSQYETTVVRVFRALYIQRIFPETDKAYRLATSVGHNEAWILGTVGERLRNP